MKSVILVVATLTLLASFAWAQTPARTKVVLTELDCMGCAKRVATKLYKVDGVAEVRVELASRTLFVAHKPGATPSPLKLWEAVEQADHKPEKVETPTATHTAKPKS